MNRIPHVAVEHRDGTVSLFCSRNANKSSTRVTSSNPPPLHEHDWLPYPGDERFQYCRTCPERRYTPGVVPTHEPRFREGDRVRVRAHFAFVYAAKIETTRVGMVQRERLHPKTGVRWYSVWFPYENRRSLSHIVRIREEHLEFAPVPVTATEESEATA